MVVHTGRSAPEPCFSHALVPLSDQCLLMHGGAPFGIASHVYIFEMNKQRWHRLEVDGDVTGLLLVRHCSIFLPDTDAATLGGRLLIIGGGAFCFSFGSSWSSSVQVDLSIATDALESGASGLANSNHHHHSSQSQGLGLQSSQLAAKQAPKVGLKVPRKSAKKWKDAMKDLGLLHPCRASQSEQESVVLALSSAILSEVSCEDTLGRLTEALQGIIFHEKALALEYISLYTVFHLLFFFLSVFCI